MLKETGLMIRTETSFLLAVILILDDMWMRDSIHGRLYERGEAEKMEVGRREEVGELGAGSGGGERRAGRRAGKNVGNRAHTSTMASKSKPRPKLESEEHS